MLSLALRSYFRNFNPLPRKEGDPDGLVTKGGIGYFNPLPRKEGDEQLGISLTDTNGISIHSLVKRETVGIDVYTEGYVISIHSLVKRETLLLQRIRQTVTEFQSTPS